MANSSAPQRGVIFWQVGTGDSTTVVIDDEHVLQVDLHDMAQADEDGAVVTAVVDCLVDVLPKRNGRPYLAGFALTHADQDHCRGFADLLSKVTIGELWATPRLWREYVDGDTVICEDARAFQKEAERRVEATRKAVGRDEQPASGDRILVVGYDTDHDEHAYSDLPDVYLTGPGKTITTLDGDAVGDVFEAFVHAPFAADCAAARNETSLAMQITLRDADGAVGHALLFGDLAYPTIMKIFQYSEDHNREERLAWDVLLAPHHCSKHVMYVDDEFESDIMDAFERHARDNAVIVSSSMPVPATNQAGENPPHAKAKARYLEIVDGADRFVCTQEWPDEEHPCPVAFGLTTSGLDLLDPVDLVARADDAAETRESAAKAAGMADGVVGVLIALAVVIVARGFRDRRRRRPVAAPTSGTGLDRAQRAVARARGTDAAPRQPIGFGAR
ncbi:hypothetical protein [Amycolatopsis pigmentata]|uniref:Metal-dependent hydrolase, beta-lactamase superfamily II n=1 Tax=Amycolatopsis pigmentata TaxID=450801 RepID=A0ABW5G0H1_9PSEU